MDCAAVNYQLPVHAPGSHLILEGIHVLARHMGIVAAVKDQNLAANVFGVGRARRVQAAVKTHHARDVGAAADEFQHASAAETVVDRRHSLGFRPPIATDGESGRLHQGVVNSPFLWDDRRPSEQPAARKPNQ